MQFHLDGYSPGDPELYKASERIRDNSLATSLPDQIDVLIIGCGPAGLTLAAQLAVFPDITTCIVDQKPGPLQKGQADGIACRTMEMFNAFGFVERVMREAYWVNETTFWQPDSKCPANISRKGRIQDVEDGLSEFPHVILNQARVHDCYLDHMLKSRSRLKPDYSRKFVSLSIDDGVQRDTLDYPVTTTFERVDLAHKGQFESVKARYVVGCDGARSAVRKSVGLSLHGDSANHAWGVMDVLAVTDFPDIRMKSLIRSANRGSIIIIPREGGYLVRLYVELGELDEGERVSDLDVTIDQLIETANDIFHPYTLNVKEVAWWSIYEIGQRLCDRYDDVPAHLVEQQLPHVFIAGDACHTHSPKAGQGMNVSMRDSFNLGWKLISVLQKRCKPSILRTYTNERQKVAKTLIEFDREWSKIMASAAQDAKDTQATSDQTTEFQEYFVQNGRYTAGTLIQYQPSIVSGEPIHQHLAEGFDVGMRFHSAQVIRLADAKTIHLGHTVQADARWRLFAFADTDDPADSSSAIHTLSRHLVENSNSPLNKYTPRGADIDSVIDVRAIFQPHFRRLDIGLMPALLLPRKGCYKLVDYEKIFCTNPEHGVDIFETRKIDRQRGCIVLVRPDQHVAHVLPLDAFDELAAFFDTFMIAQH